MAYVKHDAENQGRMSAPLQDERTIYALVTNQGTAADETGLCSDCLQNVRAVDHAKAMAHKDVVITNPSDTDVSDFHDVTENDAMYCEFCGYRQAE